MHFHNDSEFYTTALQTGHLGETPSSRAMVENLESMNRDHHPFHVAMRPAVAERRATAEQGRVAAEFAFLHDGGNVARCWERGTIMGTRHLENRIKGPLGSAGGKRLGIYPGFIPAPGSVRKIKGIFPRRLKVWIAQYTIAAPTTKRAIMKAAIACAGILRTKRLYAPAPSPYGHSGGVRQPGTFARSAQRHGRNHGGARRKPGGKRSAREGGLIAPHRRATTTTEHKAPDRCT